MRRSYFTESGVVEAIRKFHDLYGRPPTKIEWCPPIARRLGHPELAERFESEGCWPSFRVIQRLFGTWNKAIEAAGFEPLTSRRKVKWPREEIVSALAEYARTITDEVPTRRGFSKWPHGPSLTVLQRAGDWRALLEEAQRFLPFEWPLLPADPPVVIAEKSVRLRAFEVFDRDGFACTYCGRSPRVHGVVLHVDHVVPLSRGGTNDPENLTSACSACNMEKSDRLLSRMPEGLSGSTREWRPKTKYPDEDVVEMMEMRLAGATRREIAERFGLKPETVRELLKRRSVARRMRAAA